MNIGDDVIVKENPNEWEPFEKCDGTIKNIDGDKIEVEFDKRFSHKFGYEWHQGKKTVIFDKSKLEIIDLNERTDIRCNRLFPNYYHTRYSLIYKFSKNNKCCVKGCRSLAEKRILYNCWGSVSEYDVCKDHIEYDGKCGDGFPMEYNYIPFEKN